MDDVMNVTHESPTTVLRVLREGYQVRFSFISSEGSTVYGFQWRDFGGRAPFKDVVVVYVKGKDVASIKFASIPVGKLFDPLSDEKHNILVLESITVYPRDYTDFLASEEELNNHQQVLFEKMAVYSQEEPEVSSITKTFAKMLQGF